MKLKHGYKVGDGATVCGYSDRKACTVVKVTACTVTLREDKATLLNGPDTNEPDKLVWHSGGFAGHMEGTPRYACEPDPTGFEMVAWETKTGLRWAGRKVVPGRSHFYDYNF